MRYLVYISITISLSLFALGWFKAAPASQAFQGSATPTLRPTATNVGDRPSSSDGDDNGESAPALVGNIQGFVYNYSAGGAPQPGIGVVLDGGGWQIETLTDSNGFYQFSGLGFGKATLHLKVPPQAHVLTPNWPVHTYNPASTRINLGFYWGSASILPVILSLDPPAHRGPANEPFSFQIKVQNQSGGEATDGVIDLRLPVALEALQASSTQGQIDFSEHRIWGWLGTIPDGETAVLTVQARFDKADYPQTATAQVALNYQEQLTPQVVQLEITAIEPQAPEAGGRERPLEGGGTAQGEVAPTEGQRSERPAASGPNGGGQSSEGAEEQGRGGAGVDEASIDGSIDGQETMSGSDQSERAEEQERSGAGERETTQSEGRIPTTGAAVTPSEPAWSLLILSLLVIIGLSIAGWRAFAKRA